MQNVHFRLTYYAQKRFSLLKLLIVGLGSLFRNCNYCSTLTINAQFFVL